MTPTNMISSRAQSSKKLQWSLKDKPNRERVSLLRETRSTTNFRENSWVPVPLPTTSTSRSSIECLTGLSKDKCQLPWAGISTCMTLIGWDQSWDRSKTDWFKDGNLKSLLAKLRKEAILTTTDLGTESMIITTHLSSTSTMAQTSLKALSGSPSHLLPHTFIEVVTNQLTSLMRISSCLKSCRAK